MHGAPGRQSGMDHSGRVNYNKLWSNKIHPNTAGEIEALRSIQAFSHDPNLPDGSISAEAPRIKITIMVKIIFQVIFP